MTKKRVDFIVKLKDLISESQQEIDEGIYGGDYEIFKFMKECFAELKAKDEEIARLKEDLFPFLSHDEHCDTNNYLVSNPKCVCTCGLEQTLKENDE